MSCKKCGHHDHNCKCKCKELDKCRCDVEINSLDCIRVQQDFSCLGIKKGDKMTKLILELVSKACNPLVPLPGKNGVGIASTSYDPDTGVLTLTYTNGSTFDTEDLRGEQGEIGVGIESTSYDGGTGELTLNYTDGSSFTTDDLRGPAGADGDPGPNQLLIQNSLIVAKNGNDGTGARNDWAKPFLTIQVANAAAIAGDIVIVFPGSYSVGGAAMNKNGVAYYFYKGASVVSSSNLITDSGVADSINIFGEGDFGSTNLRVLYTTNSGTNIHFEFNQAIGFFDGITIGDADNVYIRGKYCKAITQYTATVRGNSKGIMDIDVYDGSVATFAAETVGFRNHSTDEVLRNFEIRGKILSNTNTISGSLSTSNSPGLRLIANVEIYHDSGTLTPGISALHHSTGLLKFEGIITSVSNSGVIVTADSQAVLLLKNSVINSEYSGVQVIGNTLESVEIDGCSITKGANQNVPAVYVSANVLVSELEIRNTVIINEGTDDNDHGIYTEDENSTIRLDNVKVALEIGTVASSIKSGVTRTVNIESIFSSNTALDVSVTNGVTGSLVVIDSLVQSNTLKFK